MSPRAAVALVTSLSLLVACTPAEPEDPTSSPSTSNGSGSGGGGGNGGGSGSAGGSGGGGGSGGAGGSGGGGPIVPLPTQPFTLGGQNGWEHDEAQPSGYFHTYDALTIGPAGFAPRKVHVYLPRAYSQTDARYPVVYMNDGHTTFWPGGPGNITWDVDQCLSELYAAKAIPPVIVVALHPIEREREYSHVDMGDGKPCCDVEEYTAYVADDVKGWIDAHYRTKPEPANTAIVGSSRGGLAAFYMANRRPDRFGKAGCLSPSFWAGLDPVFGGNFPGGPLSSSPLVTTLAATLSSPSIRPRLWIDWGLVRTGGFHNEAIEAAATTRGIEMVALLEQSYGYVEGAELSWYEDPIGAHDEISWNRRFPEVMKALFAP